MSTAPWLTSYEPGVPASILPVEGLFHSALLSAAAEAPGQPALEHMGRTISFAELEAGSGRAAAALVRDGLSPGSPVIVALPSSPAQALACLGILRAGGVAVPIEPCPQLVASVLSRIHAPVVFAAADLVDELEPVAAGARARLVSVDMRRSLPATVRAVLWFARASRQRARPTGAQDWAHWLAAGSGGAACDVPSAAPALVVAGSGAESRWPRFGHEELVSGATQLAAWLTDAVPGHDAWLLLRPLGSGAGFVCALGAASRLRARVLLSAGGSPADVLDALRYRRPALVWSGAHALAQLLDDPRFTPESARCVRVWITDEPLPPPVESAAQERLGLALRPGYGHRAVAGLATCTPINGLYAPGSVGVPLPDVEARAVSDEGHPVPLGETGRLELRGPNASARGWFRPGVRAWIDERGCVYAESGATEAEAS